MSIVCQYAIVRFLPYMETGEFANIGVLAFAPKTGYWDFKLAPKAFPRVSRFFSELDKKVYREAVTGFAHELAEVKTLANDLGGREMMTFAREITRVRESLIRYSEIRTVMTANPQMMLEELYERYVGRNFVTRDVRERAMVVAIKQQLRDNNLRRFYKQYTFNADYRAIQFPLVRNEKDKHNIIKPLALDQKEPSKLIEHAEEWKNKIEWLLNRDCIREDELLLALERPKATKGEIPEAFEVAKGELRELKVELVDFEEKSRIMEFACQANLQLH